MDTSSYKAGFHIGPLYSVTGKEFFSMRQWPFIIQNQCDILKTNVTFSNLSGLFNFFLGGMVKTKVNNP